MSNRINFDPFARIGAGITIPVLTVAIYLWVLDIVGISRWTAETIGEYIGMIIIAAGG